MHTATNLGIGMASGSAAGLCVDVVLYPLDTIKTRLQSAPGFLKSGGFHGIYRGLGSVAVGSVPGAALFFTTYEVVKSLNVLEVQPNVHMMAACCGEMIACLVRVPTEVVKQRAMTSINSSSFSVFSRTLQSEGFFGLYRGYFVTLSRELPFSVIQFPLWEYFKTTWGVRQGSPVEPWQSGVCGAAAGGFAAAVTTPLDVAKTRIMLAATGSKLAQGNIWKALLTIHTEKGFAGLYAGIVPRTLWISAGGCIFLGIYDAVKLLLMRNLVPAT